MSFFKDDDLDGLKESINYFTSLSDEKKAFIVANVSNTDKYSDVELKHIDPLLEAIANEISKRNDITIANKISELGMDYTYAQLFVKNVIEKRPTLDYQLNILERMDESSFRDTFLNSIRKTYFDFKTNSEIIDEEKISSQQFNAILHVYREAIRAILRGENSKNIIRKECAKTIKSDVKIDAIIETVDTTKDKLRDTVTFSNVQDVWLEIQNMKEQNKIILESLKEILQAIKESRRNI